MLDNKAVSFWKKRYLVVPAPSVKAVWIMITIWALSLVVVDWGAKLSARHPFVLVSSPAMCDLKREPKGEEIRAEVAAGDVLRVRNFERKGSDLCYSLATTNGDEGWAPYHPSFMAPAGYFVEWRFLGH
jgi:hypothetical protein